MNTKEELYICSKASLCTDDMCKHRIPHRYSIYMGCDMTACKGFQNLQCVPVKRNDWDE